MSFRFRKSIKLAPGIRLNLGLGGISWSLGGPGASVNIGKQGTFLNLGIPGTGLSYRQKLATAAAPSSSSRKIKDDHFSSAGNSALASNDVLTAPEMVTLKVIASLDDNDGVLRFKGSDGNPLPDNLVAPAFEQNIDAIKSLFKKTCDEINAPLEAMKKIHLETPDFLFLPSYSPKPFDEPSPAKSDETDNQTEYQRRLSDWEARKNSHTAAELVRERFVELEILNNIHAMEDYFGEKLKSVAWPRETQVSFEISEGGKRVLIDVDLPEVEDVPTRLATYNQGADRLLFQEMSELQTRLFYVKYIHATGFRIIGEAFASLPRLNEVVLSAYSQRFNKGSNSIENEYLYSTKVLQKEWKKVRLDQLDAVDVMAVFEEFSLCRELSSNGVFLPIVPFES